MLALGNQTLVDRTGEHGDAVPTDLVAEVLAGDADGTRAGRTQDIHIQVVPLLRVAAQGEQRSSEADKYACASRGELRGQAPGEPWRSNCLQMGVIPWC